ETLALFVGRHSLTGLFDTVLHERGGAPLHFLLAWAVAHLGFGLEGLRTLSAAFAVASLPVVALLLARLAGPARALLATAVVATSWTFLFHGVYGRMYSLFLLTSALSFLALLHALDRGGRKAWALWAAAILAAVATHPYGALLLAAQGTYVLVARRESLRGALRAFGAVAVLGIPFWLTDLVLAGRFDAGVGGGGRLDTADYLWQVAGDFTAGFPVLPAVLVAAAAGLAALPRDARVLAACAAVVPLAALVLARSSGSPETRHLIFLLPFVALAVGAGLARLGRGWGPAALAALVVAQVAWTWDRTPELFEWEPDVRQEARAEAAAYLAAVTEPDDVLLGYDPLFLQAWELEADFPLVVLPRADADLALHNLLELDRPLGHGLWVLDASKTTNAARSLDIPLTSPRPASAFETRVFGPFLVIRTRAPVVTPKGYLERAGQAMLVGKRLYLGDADINLPTIERAARALRGYGAARSPSTSSR
ncbi:MAG TPA: glycosyltransferase family 39 protein, partial [Gaiellaceae bacterium]|nr:glycosyltransferase family 39 protein [Gaiellaceae bacterium]